MRVGAEHATVCPTRPESFHPKRRLDSQLFNWIDKDSGGSLDASELALASAALRPGTESASAEQVEASQRLLDTIAKSSGSGAAPGGSAELDFAGFVRIMTMQARTLRHRLLPSSVCAKTIAHTHAHTHTHTWLTSGSRRCRKSPTLPRPRSYCPPSR